MCLEGEVQSPAHQSSASTITVTYVYIERINLKSLQLQLQLVILRNGMVLSADRSNASARKGYIVSVA